MEVVDVERFEQVALMEPKEEDLEVVLVEVAGVREVVIRPVAMAVHVAMEHSAGVVSAEYEGPVLPVIETEVGFAARPLLSLVEAIAKCVVHAPSDCAEPVAVSTEIVVFWLP